MRATLLGKFAPVAFGCFLLLSLVAGLSTSVAADEVEELKKLSAIKLDTKFVPSLETVSPVRPLFITSSMSGAGNSRRFLLYALEVQQKKGQIRDFRVPSGETDTRLRSAFSEDGKLIAVGHGEEINVVQADGLRPGKSLKFSGAVQMVGISNDRQVVVAFGRDNDFMNPNIVRIYDVKTGELKQKIEETDVLKIIAAAYDPASDSLALFERDGKTDPKHSLTVVEASTGKTIRNVEVELDGAAKRTVRQFIISPHGRTACLMLNGEEQMHLVDLEEGIARTRPLAWPIAFNATGELAALCNGRTLTIQKGGKSLDLPVEHRADLTCVAFLDPPRYVVTGSEDWSVRVWDLVSRECIAVGKETEAVFGGLFQFNDPTSFYAFDRTSRQVIRWKLPELVVPEKSDEPESGKTASKKTAAQDEE